MNGSILRKGKVGAPPQHSEEDDCTFQTGEPGVRMEARDGGLWKDIVFFLDVHPDDDRHQPPEFDQLTGVRNKLERVLVLLLT